METITNIKQELHLIERYLEEELETGHTAKRLEGLLAYVQKQAKNISFQPPVSGSLRKYNEEDLKQAFKYGKDLIEWYMDRGSNKFNGYHPPQNETELLERIKQ